MPDGPITLDASEVEEAPTLDASQVEEAPPKQYPPEVEAAIRTVPSPTRLLDVAAAYPGTQPSRVPRNWTGKPVQVPGIGVPEVAGAMTEMLAPGTITPGRLDVSPAETVKTGVRRLQTPGQRVTGALQTAAGLTEAAGPLAGPMAVESPGTFIRAGAEGYLAGKGAKYGAGALGATPEQQEYAENIGQMAPILAHAALRPEVGVETTPEGTRAAGTVLGGRAGAGVAVTPEAVTVRGKVGPLEGTKTFARRPAARPAVEPPTIEAEAPFSREEIARAQEATNYAGPEQAEAYARAQRSAAKSAVAVSGEAAVAPKAAGAASPAVTAPAPEVPKPVAAPPTVRPETPPAQKAGPAAAEPITLEAHQVEEAKPQAQPKAEAAPAAPTQFQKGDTVQLADGRRGKVEYVAPSDKQPVVRVTTDEGGKVSVVGQKAIGELQPGTKYKYGSTQANIPEGSEAHTAMEAARQRIADSDLAGDGKDIGGNHVTVRYGIQSEDVEGVKKYLASLAPFEASLGKTASFKPSKNSDGAAVIQAPIESPELQKINAEIEKHGDFAKSDFPTYSPHATIAYVDPDKANRYVGMDVTAGKKFPVNEIAITDKEGRQTVVKLEGKPSEGKAAQVSGEVAKTPGAAATPQKQAKVTGTPAAAPSTKGVQANVEQKPAVTPVKAEGSVKPVPQAQTGGSEKPQISEQTFSKAAMDLIGGHIGNRVRLAELRPKLEALGYNREAQDEAIRRLQSEGAISVIPFDLPSDIGPADRAAQIDIGGVPRQGIVVRRRPTQEEPEAPAEEVKPAQLSVKMVPGGFGVIGEGGKILSRWKTRARAEAQMADMQKQPAQAAAPTEPAPEETAKPTGAESLAEAVYQKLSKGESLGNVTEFNKLAEQHFGSSRVSGQWTPKDAFDAMETGVNKYLSVFGQTLMAQDAITGLGRLRELMPKITSQGVRTEEQLKAQQFSTPPTEAYIAAKVAGIKATDTVLEPSAGNGGLAVFAKAAGAKVATNEYSDRRVANLKYLGFDKDFPITKHDGEIINSRLDEKVKPTVVLMNPPFSSGVLKAREGVEVKNRTQYGFNHVDSALQRLEPGGRLVAILGGGRSGFDEGASLTASTSRPWFQKVAQKYNIRANVRISGKEYQKYGTSFATRIIVIDKTGPTTGAAVYSNGRVPPDIVQGNVDTLEEAYNLLRGVAEDRPAVGGQDVTARTEGTRPATELVREGGAGQPEAPSRGGAGEGVSPTGVRVPAGREPEAAGELQRPDRRNEPDRGAGAVQPSETGERTPVREPGPPAQQPNEAVPAQGAPVSGEGADRERPVRQPEVEGLVLGHEDQSVREQVDSSAYVTYRPTLKGPAHPGSIVETKTMSTVPMPKVTYRPSLPESVIKEGRLSAVQLEAVSIAGQQNDIVLPSGHRASALIGDGTGVGKGRIGASILWDNWNKGRKRLVWVSEKWDLMEDAKRDLNGIGAGALAKGVKGFDKYKATDPIEHEGVLFTTYALMRSVDAKGNSRSAQLQKWLRGKDEADGAYMLFDESHNLKNAVVGQMGVASEIGQTVRKLLNENPKMRTVSLSATAASDVMNLGYLDRLGLWGPGTPFPNGFGEFAANISGGGISAMEMVARELKAQGKYVSRTLSYKGVTYNEVEHKLTPDQKELYRTATKAWKLVSQKAEDTIKNTNNGGARATARFLSLFYGAQLRFFNVLLTTLKIPTAVEDANKALADGKSVVITLVNTNEAAQNREKNRERAKGSDDDEPPDYDFGPAEMLTDLVQQHYPTQQYADGVDDNGNPVKIPVVDGDGNPVHNPEAIKQKNELLAQIRRDLKLPKNPLDILIDSFGGPSKVAELTGRKERYDEGTGKFVKRGDANVKRDEINLSEMRAFQDGKKRVAILSNAAGTGISLHADTNAKNQQKRHHITLQLGWSADKAMQMLGRTHRANQTEPPEYITITSDLGGEKRFSSVIAKRLGNLGALSKGQKDATASADVLEKTNFDSDQGKKGSQTFYRQLMRNQGVPGTEGWDTNDPTRKMPGMSVLRDLAVLKKDPQSGVESVPDADQTNVTRLLNRLLALDPDIQNAAYNYYYDIFTAIVNQAIEDGTLDTGVKTMKGDEFSVKEERQLSTDPTTGAKTYYYPVEAQVRTNRVPPKDVEKLMKKEVGAQVMQNEKGKLVLARPAADIVHANGTTSKASYVVYPNNGVQQKVENWKLNGFKEVGEVATERKQKLERDLDYEKSNLDYKKRTAERYDNAQWAVAQVKASEDKIDDIEKELKELGRGDAQEVALSKWKEAYDAAPSHETEEHHLLGGAVLRWWNQIREAVPGTLDIYTAVDSKTGKRIVGVEIPANSIRGLLSRVGGGGSTVDSGQLSTDVIKNNLSYELERGIQVRKGRVGGKPVLQLIPPNDDVAQNLKRMGAIYERGITPIYYVPSKDTGYGKEGDRYQADEQVLDKILGAYPVKQAEAGAQPQGASVEDKIMQVLDRSPKSESGQGLLVGRESLLKAPELSGVSPEDLQKAMQNLADSGKVQAHKAESGGEAAPSIYGIAARLIKEEAGTFTPANIAYAPARIKAAYGKLVQDFIDKQLKIGDKYWKVKEYDPTIADTLHLVDNAPRYFREKAKANLDKVTKGLSEDQIRLAHLMVDSDSRDDLKANHPTEYDKATRDTQVMDAVQAFQPLQQELTADRQALGWPVRMSLHIEEDPTSATPFVVKDRQGNQVADFKTEGQAAKYVDQNATVEPHLKRTYPEHMRNPLPAEVGGGPFTGSFYGGKGLRPPKMDKKSREMSAAYHYEHGAKDFSGYVESYTQTKEAVLKQNLFDQLADNATLWKAGTAQPPKIEYNGETYYRPDIALKAKQGGQTLEQYSIYDPSRGEKFLIKTPDWSTLTTGKPGIGPQDRYLAPKTVVDALENYDSSRGGEGAGKLRKFFQEQIVGLFGPVVHVNNIIRHLGQAEGLGAFDPRSWGDITRVMLSSKLRERMQQGVDDSTIDMLVRRGAYTDWRDIGNTNAYIGGNMNPANWVRAFGKGVLFDPKFLKGWGGLDPKARVVVADYLRSHDPNLTDQQIADAVNDAFGNYNRANWTERQRLLARFMLFPGWDAASAKWFLRHPFIVGVAGALVVLAANLGLHKLGLNKGDDWADMSYIHLGDRKYRTGAVSDAMGEHFTAPVLSAIESKLKGESPFIGGTEGLMKGSSALLGQLAGPTVEMIADELYNKKYIGSAQEIVKPEDRYTPGTWAPNRELEKRIAFATLRGLPAINRFLTPRGDLDWKQGLGAVTGVSNYKYGAEERLKANAAKSENYSKEISMIAEKDPDAAAKYVEDPVKAAYLTFNGYFSELTKDLKEIDKETSQVKMAGDLTQKERKEALKDLEDARNQLLSSADALNDQLSQAKMKKP